MRFMQEEGITMTNQEQDDEDLYNEEAPGWCGCYVVVIVILLLLAALGRCVLL